FAFGIADSADRAPTSIEHLKLKVRTRNGLLFMDSAGFERLCLRELKFQLAQNEVTEIFRSMDPDEDG
ncbi:unnamed protein product, partial [Polarella glacialis]